MKNLVILLVMLLGVSTLFAQNEKNSSDTTKLKIGGRTIIIIEDEKESNDEKNIEEEIIIEVDSDENSIVKKEKKKKKYKARNYSRWAGLNIGLNQLTILETLGQLDDNTEIWQLNPWKSRTWNFNILEFSLSLVKKHILLTTGLGFEYRNYSFDKNIDLEYTYWPTDHKTIDPVINNDLDYSKNKLHVSYVQIPLLLEINTSSRPKKGLYLAGGLIGGYKMNSKLTQKYTFEDQDIKKIIDDSFNLNPYQLEGTLRIGFDRFMVFTNFDLLPVFEEGKSSTGDQLANLTIGLQLVGF